MIDLITYGLIIGSIALWIVYDIYLIKNEHTTISVFINRWAWKYPLLPFFFGLTPGHWFFRGEIKTLDFASLTVMGVVVFWQILDLAGFKIKGKTISKNIADWKWYAPWQPFLLGIPVGALWW